MSASRLRASVKRGKAKWIRADLMFLLCESADMGLVIGAIPVTPNQHGVRGYIVSAVETPNQSPLKGRISAKSAVRAVEQIFENHGHDVLGNFPTWPKARSACEKYARQWLTRRKTIEKCACGPIGKGKPAMSNVIVREFPGGKRRTAAALPKVVG